MGRDGNGARNFGFSTRGRPISAMQPRAGAVPRLPLTADRQQPSSALRRETMSSAISFARSRSISDALEIRFSALDEGRACRSHRRSRVSQHANADAPNKQTRIRPRRQLGSSEPKTSKGRPLVASPFGPLTSQRDHVKYVRDGARSREIRSSGDGCKRVGQDE